MSGARSAGVVVANVYVRCVLRHAAPSLGSLWSVAPESFTVPSRPAWHSLAACRGLTNLVYAHNALGRVRVLCAACPVRVECAAEGERLDDELGVYGVRAGVGPGERVRLRERAALRQRPA